MAPHEVALITVNPDRYLAFIRQRGFDYLDLLLQRRQVGKVPLDEDDVEMTPLDLPGEFAQPPDQLRIFLARRREIRAVIAEYEQSLLLLGDIIERARRVLRIRDQNLLLSLKFGAEDLPQPGRAAPDKDDLIARATRQQLSPLALIEEIVRVETSGRTSRKTQRLLSAARIGRFKPMADFDWNWPQKIDRDLIERALSLEFVRDGESQLDRKIRIAPADEAGLDCCLAPIAKRSNNYAKEICCHDIRFSNSGSFT